MDAVMMGPMATLYVCEACEPSMRMTELQVRSADRRTCSFLSPEMVLTMGAIISARRFACAIVDAMDPNTQASVCHAACACSRITACFDAKGSSMTLRTCKVRRIVAQGH